MEQMQSVERWGVFEVACEGPSGGNPFTEQWIRGTFSGKKSRDLLSCEIPEFTRPEIIQFHTPYSYSRKRFHIVSEIGEYLPDFPVLSLYEGDSHELPCLRHKIVSENLIWFRDINIDTFDSTLQILNYDRSVEFDDIFLLHLIAGMHHLVGEIAIIGEYDKSRGILIQTTDVEKQAVVPYIDKVSCILRLIRIIVRAYISPRFIESDIIQLVLKLNGLCIDLDYIVLIDLCAHFPDDFVVHHDTAFCNKAFTCSS